MSGIAALPEPEHGRGSAPDFKIWAHYACLAVGSFLLLMGCMLAYRVFGHVWSIVKAPKGLQDALAVYKTMIEAQLFNVELGGKVYPFGSFVAMAVMCFWYYFCIRIPLLIADAGRLLLARTFEERKAGRQAG